MQDNFSIIPKLEDILRITNPKDDNQQPTPDGLAKMQKILDKYGYQNTCPKLYNAIREYGAKEYDKTNVRGLFLRGNVGTGKTLGISLLGAMCKWRMITARDIQTAYRNMNENDFFTFIIDGYEEYKRPADTLIIDDIGSEDFPFVHYGIQCNLIADVLERRYRVAWQRHGIRTFCTSNLSDAELLKRYGKRVDDRMNEMFRFVSINDGVSHRR